MVVVVGECDGDYEQVLVGGFVVWVEGMELGKLVIKKCYEGVCVRGCWDVQWWVVVVFMLYVRLVLGVGYFVVISRDGLILN